MFTIQEIEQAIDRPFDSWAKDCHAVALAIVKSDLISGDRRVARGWCEGVGGQHSWVVVGKDCYAPDAQIIDPTLWSYVDSVEGVWYGTTADGLHTPHGAGSIWAWGRPSHGGGESIPSPDVEGAAADFLKMLGPLDYVGWSVLASSAPVGGWPAAEVIKAMALDKELSGLVPIDRVGMLTDLNPSGLYLP
jgi:hypothetical protein